MARPPERLRPTYRWAALPAVPPATIYIQGGSIDGSIHDVTTNTNRRSQQFDQAWEEPCPRMGRYSCPEPYHFCRRNGTPNFATTGAHDGHVRSELAALGRRPAGLFRMRRRLKHENAASHCRNIRLTTLHFMGMSPTSTEPCCFPATPSSGIWVVISHRYLTENDAFRGARRVHGSGCLSCQ